MRTVKLYYRIPGDTEEMADREVIATPLEERRVDEARGGWSQRFEINGAIVWVGVSRGKSVRIAFKPRGQNRGFKYSGYVRDANARELWSGDVGGSLGARGILYRALFQSHAFGKLLPEALKTEAATV